MYAMMQCKAESENLAQILGYQIWAVTNALKVRNVDLLSRNRFRAPVVENLKKSQNVIFFWQFLTVSLIHLSIFNCF